MNHLKSKANEQNEKKQKLIEGFFYRKNLEYSLLMLSFEEDYFHIFSYRIALVEVYNRHSLVWMLTKMNHRTKLIVVVEDNNDSIEFHSLSFCMYSNDQRRLTKIHDEDNYAFHFRYHLIMWNYYRVLLSLKWVGKGLTKEEEEEGQKADVFHLENKNNFNLDFDN